MGRAYNGVRRAGVAASHPGSALDEVVSVDALARGRLAAGSSCEVRRESTSGPGREDPDRLDWRERPVTGVFQEKLEEELTSG